VIIDVDCLTVAAARAAGSVTAARTHPLDAVLTALREASDAVTGVRLLRDQLAAQRTREQA
jgi:hypothetical protein